MTGELERRGEGRRLIFENVANGVPIQQIMSVFRRSEAEVMAEVKFVGKKIAEYRFRRHLPPLACSDLREIRWNRLALLDTVRKLGDLYLSSELILPRIAVQKVDHPGALREVKHRMEAHR
jgi:hypothetical protein